MQISLKWLQEFIQVNRPPAELAQALTMGGIEATGLREVGGEFDAVRVGEIQEIHHHPQAQKLSLCRVNLGNREISVVCGAPNVATGQKVAVILPGGRLPDGRLIEAAKIRGEVSEGMICSGAELGLNEDSEGILILPSEMSLGSPLAQALGLSDHLLEVEVTPNRGDCLSVLGIAREVSALTGRPLTDASPSVLEEGPPAEEMAGVSVECPLHCPRYAARIVEGVSIGPSPPWLQWRLKTAGMRPINNVVDVTNLVMLERGQPLHAFDYERLRERRIVVRTSRSEDGSFKTLDGLERTLDSSACMICDGVGPIAIGGVMGGAETEVSASTRTLLLEGAHFSAASIRKTARSLGLTTEASYRFERGVDPSGVPVALDRAADLIRELARGQVARGRIDIYPSPIQPASIQLRTSQVKRVLGISLPAKTLGRYLGHLGMEVSTKGKGILVARVPTHRPDLTQEVDLMEEVARLHGYDRFPKTLPSRHEAPVSRGSQRDFLMRVREILAGAGLQEVINSSFVSERELEILGLPKGHGDLGALRLRNPLSQDGALLRTSLISGLLRDAALNFSRGIMDLRIFEVGTVFHPGEEGALPREEARVGGLLSGRAGPALWSEEKRERDFFDLKGTLENLTRSLRLPPLRYRSPGAPYLDPRRSATLDWEGKVVGVAGEIHPALRQRLDLPQSVLLFELSVDLQGIGLPIPSFKPLPRHPATTRDLSILVEEGMAAEEIMVAIREVGGEWLREVTLFDLHLGAPILSGQKSLAFALTYRAEDRTLSGEEVNARQEAIIAHLSKTFGARLRS